MSTVIESGSGTAAAPAVKPVAAQATATATRLRWLLRREFWEHKGAMLWAPAIVAGLLVVLTAGALAVSLLHPGVHVGVFVGENALDHASAADLPAGTVPLAARAAASVYILAGMPLFGILAGVAFFYCLGALYDERRDRSILFWKSLPVSDGMTVLSKAATALVVAPLITIALATAASLGILVLACIGTARHGMNMAPDILGMPDLYLAPLRLLAMLPVYIVWALPTAGWLLLVSSWARTKPFLWAVGVPLVALLLLKSLSAAVVNMAGIDLGLMEPASNLVATLLTGLVPGIWFAYNGNIPHGLAGGVHQLDLGDVVTQSWMTLAGWEAWLGALLGAALLFGAIRLRRWRDDA
jgi:ABC-2 type transport system permease protein